MEHDGDSSPLLRLSSLSGPVVPVAGMIDTGPSSSRIFNPAHTGPARPPAILEGDISFHGPCFRRPEDPPKDAVLLQRRVTVVLDEEAAASSSGPGSLEHEASTVLPRMVEALAIDTSDDIVLYPRTGGGHSGEADQAASSRDSTEAAIQGMLALHQSRKNTNPRYWIEARVNAGVHAHESVPAAQGEVLPGTSKAPAESSSATGGQGHESQDVGDADCPSAMQF